MIKEPGEAVTEWMLDSGGFSELSMFGEWRTPAIQYAGEVKRWHNEVGRLRRAAIQDWMCEPFILQKTGQTVEQHQRHTVSSYLELSGLLPGFEWLPVLQGWTRDDYMRHVDMYYKARIYLHELPLVGIGSVCRRQHTAEAEAIIREIANQDIRLHGFGFKMQGLARVSDALESADSLAWSFHARRRPPLPGCVGHKNCANCLTYALQWRKRMLDGLL